MVFLVVLKVTYLKNVFKPFNSNTQLQTLKMVLTFEPLYKLSGATVQMITMITALSSCGVPF